MMLSKIDWKVVKPKRKARYYKLNRRIFYKNLKENLKEKYAKELNKETLEEYVQDYLLYASLYGIQGQYTIEPAKSKDGFKYIISTYKRYKTVMYNKINISY